MKRFLLGVGRSINNFTSLGGTAPAVLTRFFRYILASSSTLLLDLFILGFLTEVLGIYYLFSVSFSYATSSTLNYIFNRYWGFRGTKRGFVAGYFLFLCFGVLGLSLTISLMWLFVSFFGLHYSLSRIIVAMIEGTILFILNSLYTFRIPLVEIKSRTFFKRR